MSNKDQPGTALPKELEPIRAAALGAIQPIAPLEETRSRDGSFFLTARRTKAGRELPEYYLVYFLLVDLLGFRNLGRWEKTDWIIPIDFRGQAFHIEYRKFGVGIFVPDADAHEEQAREIVILIQKGARSAEPYFSWLAEQAVAESKLNVMNRSEDLFARFNFLLAEYQNKWAEAVARKDEHHVERKEENGATVTIGSSPAYELRKHAEWLGLSAIEAFFSWTEHVFIHLAILTGKITTGSEVDEMVDADWASKFKKALTVEEPATKALFDKLISIRRQIRNFFAHGSFGKQGEAFSFHSGAGAVPVLLPHKTGQHRFSLVSDVTSDERTALKVMQDFITHLWSGDRMPAQIYIQESGLPTILPLASDGTYARAMSSNQEMKSLVDAMVHSFDSAADMDW
jgi:hypothetical protein